MQQVFLRWNQGQDLRQALITIAISIILADQMLAHFGGVAEDIAWPRNFDTFVEPARRRASSTRRPACSSSGSRSRSAACSGSG